MKLPDKTRGFAPTECSNLPYNSLLGCFVVGSGAQWVRYLDNVMRINENENDDDDDDDKEDHYDNDDFDKEEEIRSWQACSSNCYLYF